MKEIAYLQSRANQLSSNLIEMLVKEHNSIQQQYMLALKKIEELEKNSKNTKK
jgi:hypothetical protein